MKAQLRNRQVAFTQPCSANRILVMGIDPTRPRYGTDFIAKLNHYLILAQMLFEFGGGLHE